jgi:hypothetical protein
MPKPGRAGQGRGDALSAGLLCEPCRLCASPASGGQLLCGCGQQRRLRGWPRGEQLLGGMRQGAAAGALSVLADSRRPARIAWRGGRRGAGVQGSMW